MSDTTQGVPDAKAGKTAVVHMALREMQALVAWYDQLIATWTPEEVERLTAAGHALGDAVKLMKERRAEHVRTIEKTWPK